MVNAVKENTTKDTYSHLIGFLCHYALDVKIHPYVYHNVGVYKKEDPTTHLYRGLHLKFERSIDAVMIKKEKGIEPNKLKLHKTYFMTNHVPLDVMNVMNYTIKQTYDKDHGGVMYLICTNKMYKNVKKIINDSIGIKKQIYKFIDLFSKEDMFFKDLSFYKHIEDYDYLNESQSTWYHPITNEPSNLTVEELFRDAKVFALDLIKNVRGYLLEGKDMDISSIFTNLSFNSGLDCDITEPMKYFNIYRK
jgi:hypothetical protein